MDTITENTGLLKDLLFKYFLLLAILTNFLSLPCFGMMILDKEDIIFRKNCNYGDLTERNYKEYDDEVITIENEKNNYTLDFCCSNNFFYYLNSLLDIFSQNNQCNLHLGSKSFLEALPNETINIITTYLDPLSIVKLSHVSRRFREFLNDEFWIKYNLSQNYQTFNEECSYLLILSSKVEAPPIKVMVSNYHFKIGIQTDNKNLIKKSSTLGLPKAKKHLQEKQISYIPYMPSSGSYGSNYNIYKEYNFHKYCHRCRVPMCYCQCYRFE